MPKSKRSKEELDQRQRLIERIEANVGTLDGIEGLTTEALNKLHKHVENESRVAQIGLPDCFPL